MEASTWDIISAIGQVAGAIATFAAVVVALHQNKPKLRFTQLQKVTSSMESHVKGFDSGNKIYFRPENIFQKIENFFWWRLGKELKEV